MTLRRMDHTGNAPQTTLQSAISAVDTSIPLASGTGYPVGTGTGPFVIVVDPGLAGEEKILCSSRSGNTLTVSTSPAGRGYDGTVASGHAPSAPVQHVLAAIEVDDDNDHVYTLTRDDHTQYARTDGTRAFTGGVTVTTGGATITGAVGITGNETVTGSETVSGALTGNPVVASGLTGAVAASRYVGATASGAPTVGTFNTGDFVVDQSGTFWICTAPGTPGTWAAQAKDAATVHIAGVETVTGAKTFSAALTPSGGLTGPVAVTGNETVSGTLGVTGALTGSSTVTGTALAASGLIGATAPSRHVGGTVSGAPIAGTFAVGDFVIDQTGLVWICTVAGTPGTWTAHGDGVWTAYTPTFSSTGGGAAIGNGTIVGAYQKIGKLLAFRINFTVGSTTAGGSGFWTWALPPGITSVAAQPQLVQAVENVSGGNTYLGFGNIGNVGVGATVVSLNLPTSAASTAMTPVTAASPFNQAAGNQITITGVIEVQ